MNHDLAFLSLITNTLRVACPLRRSGPWPVYHFRRSDLWLPCSRPRPLLHRRVKIGVRDNWPVSRPHLVTSMNLLGNRLRAIKLLWRTSIGTAVCHFSVFEYEYIPYLTRMFNIFYMHRNFRPSYPFVCPDIQPRGIYALDQFWFEGASSPR